MDRTGIPAKAVKRFSFVRPPTAHTPTCPPSPRPTFRCPTHPRGRVLPNTPCWLAHPCPASPTSLTVPWTLPSIRQSTHAPTSPPPPTYPAANPPIPHPTRPPAHPTTPTHLSTRLFIGLPIENQPIKIYVQKHSGTTDEEISLGGEAGARDQGSGGSVPHSAAAHSQHLCKARSCRHDHGSCARENQGDGLRPWPLKRGHYTPHTHTPTHRGFTFPSHIPSSPRH